MATFVFLFVLMFAPVFFIILAWFLTSVFRIYFPEKMLPIHYDPAWRRREATQKGLMVPVGVQDIFEDQQRLRRERPPVYYEYDGVSSDGFPSEWECELWERRN
ncbi:MAG TPA: hypothetical protein PLL64_04685 [Rhodothermales bacterium]|nr:hypothetical protein [Rhodothermales bacterium]HRR07387.1 hypothetical protein [Rhodothermales bacterium]